MIKTPCSQRKDCSSISDQGTKIPQASHVRGAAKKSKRKKRLSIGEDVEKLAPTCTVGRNVRWHNCFGKAFGNFLKSNCALPYNPVIPHLSVYSREVKAYVYTKTCIQMFLADSSVKPGKNPNVHKQEKR